MKQEITFAADQEWMMILSCLGILFQNGSQFINLLFTA